MTYKNTSTTHLPCPTCPSKDAYSIDDKGCGYCFSCGHSHKVKDIENSTVLKLFDEEADDELVFKPFSPLTDTFRAFRDISKETIQKYQVDVRLGEGGPEALYPFFKDGEHVANKIRFSKLLPDGSKNKRPFMWEGTKKGVDLFGMKLFPPSSAKAITVTEGQDDAMAAFEMMGSKYPSISVHSASEAERNARDHFEYLNSFDTIVLCFDSDEPGQLAAKKFASVFTPGKVKMFQPRDGFKDANDYKMAGKGNEFAKQWWQAPFFKPDGLKMGTEMLEEILNRPTHFTVKYPWESLNAKTYGMRLSEAVIINADTGVGKTSFIKEIEYKLLADPELKEKEYGIGFLHLEETNSDTCLGLMSIHNSKPYHLPDTERTSEELRGAFDACINTDRVVLWDHFGSNSVDAVLDKVRHMHALGCKYIVLDHLSIIVSDQSGDERKQLDEISTKLKTLCMNLNIALMAVVHTNRQGQIRGTAGIEQLANIVIKLERDKESTDEWRRNVTKVSVQKNRFCGRTGPGIYLWYNADTGRLTELDKDEIERYESGGTLPEDQRW